jgi:hypothetical protein
MISGRGLETTIKTFYPMDRTLTPEDTSPSLRLYGFIFSEEFPRYYPLSNYTRISPKK